MNTHLLRSTVERINHTIFVLKLNFFKKTLFMQHEGSESRGLKHVLFVRITLLKSSDWYHFQLQNCQYTCSYMLIAANTGLIKNKVTA